MRTSTGHFISFHYDNRLNPKETTCIIKDAGKQTLVETTVRKYHKDASNKKLSRRLSFEKALKEANFSKDERRIFWTTFRENVKA